MSKGPCFIFVRDVPASNFCRDNRVSDNTSWNHSGAWFFRYAGWVRSREQEHCGPGHVMDTNRVPGQVLGRLHDGKAIFDASFRTRTRSAHVRQDAGHLFKSMAPCGGGRFLANIDWCSLLRSHFFLHHVEVKMKLCSVSSWEKTSVEVRLIHIYWPCPFRTWPLFDEIIFTNARILLWIRRPFHGRFAVHSFTICLFFGISTFPLRVAFLEMASP